MMGHWGKLLGRVFFYGHSVAEPGQGLGQWGLPGVPDAPLTHTAKSPPGLARLWGFKVPLKASGRSSSEAKGTPES